MTPYMDRNGRSADCHEVVARVADRPPQHPNRPEGGVCDGGVEYRGSADPRHSTLFEEQFGSNPGRLRMLVHLPTDPPRRGAPLIVLLHGCGQSAASFAAEGGWTALADRLAVPLVLPVQSEDNNQGRCFNWFRPMHTSRGHGEALSIRHMISSAIQRFGSDPERVFIAGLSAGGAMAAALLASYPEVFAAGAVCAGLPVGAANGLSEALRHMAEAGPKRSPAGWADEVRRAERLSRAMAQALHLAWRRRSRR